MNFINVYECGIFLKSSAFIFLIITLWGCTVINSKQEHQINELIHDREVLVIDSDGQKLGVMPSSKAKQMAYDKDLDLVKIAPNAKPPVCKIMDYKKYVFEQTKREKEAKKNQKVVAVKEIRMFSAIDTHDFETKVNQATKFLKAGNKLKVSVRFRKRAIAHPQLGEELLERFGEACTEFGVVDKKPNMEGRSIVMYMSPKPQK